jgi:hypothetical protein
MRIYDGSFYCSLRSCSNPLLLAAMQQRPDADDLTAEVRGLADIKRASSDSLRTQL